MPNVLLRIVRALTKADPLDCHLHVQSAAKAEEVLRAMDQARIQGAILMGSSRFTITLRPEDGFTDYHENNLELLKARKAHPDRFFVWPTLDPLAKDNTKRLKEYVSAGASGVKLYVGHGFTFGSPPRYLFHTTPINGKPLKDVYKFCEKNRLPICLHVNTTDAVPGFREEFEDVLASYPKLRILAPHWMLASRRPTYLRSVLERYPNVVTDISFGQDAILDEGLRNITRHAKAIRKIVLDFPDRILFGSDLVCTTAPFKTVDWMVKRMAAYRNLLSSQKFKCPVTQESRTGLHLPSAVLAKVLRENAVHLLQGLNQEGKRRNG